MTPSDPQMKKWQAEGDAHTLAQANVIKQDPARLQAAAGAAKRMVEDETKRLQGLRSVANSSPQKATAPAASNERRTGGFFGTPKR